MPRRKQKTWLPGRVAPAMKPATVSSTVSTNPPPPVCVRHLLVNLFHLVYLLLVLPPFDDDEELEEASSPNVEAATLEKFNLLKVEMQRTGLVTGSM